MKSYNYSFTTNVGTGSGTIEAKSKKEAEKILRSQHEVTHETLTEKGKPGKPLVVKIEKLTLEEQ